MKKLIFTIMAFAGILAGVNAQEISGKETKGDKYYFVYAFDKAIDCYTHAKDLSVEGQRKLALSYNNMGLNIESEPVWAKIISNNLRVLDADYYDYAMTLKANGKYDESNIWMEKFRNQKPGDSRAQSFAYNNSNMPYLKADNGIYRLKVQDINTDADDFGVCYFKNKVVYSTTKTGTKMIVRKYNWSGKPYWDIYIADMEKGQLKNPKKFNKSFNGKFHDGPASFSNNGNYVAFTRNNYENKRKDKVVELQICFSTNKDGKWSEPEMFYLNNPDYSVGQPSLTEDGNTMYFASDMAGGFGGADLYKVTRVGTGAWGNLTNLGNKINTEGDEMFPNFYENTSTLYFASNGHFGLGGLDIFSSKVFDMGYDKVYNAGYPLNTRYDDFAAVINDSIREGFFTSNRIDGKGGDDIYTFDLLEVMESPTADAKFTVHAPLNIAAKRRVRETFPIRNYVFFNLGSTEISDRYVLLKKDQVKDFKETQLEVFTPKKLSGRSARQMVAYYNVLNILGDRMGKNPDATITLVGSSENGPEDGKLMAESVKKYLVDIFGISPARIAIEGRDKPKIPSEKSGFTKELDLLREGDQRVSIESNSPALLMEFRSGKDAPLKPVEIVAVQEAPLDSYVSFSVESEKDTISSWTLFIKDSANVVQKFGPYSLDRIYLSGKSILGTRRQGDYKVTMIGQTTNGLEVIKDTTVHLVLWVPSEREEGMRFSVIYEFNSSDAIKIYEKYLSEVVVPKIPIGSRVYIAGYTDVIGLESHNLKLSLARANDVKEIIKTALEKAGRTDVTFEVDGFGEDTNLSPFENGLPEERFYNRTVVIDVIPKN